MTNFKRGAIKGKTVTYAPTDRVEEYRQIVDEFMMEVFDFLPGDYLITDESSLRDFTDFGSSDTSPVWRRITEIYRIEKGVFHRSDCWTSLLRFMRARISSRKRVLRR
jgi:hypothetical protein